MRRYRLGSVGLFLIPASLLAQTPLPPTAPPGIPAAPLTLQPPAVAPAAPPLDPIMVGHMRKWDAVMKGAENFYGEVKVTRENLIRKSKTEQMGSIMCLKPGKARLRLEDTPPQGQAKDPFGYLAYIATGKSVFEYSGHDKLLTETILPEGETSKGNLLLDFLSGTISANDAMKRFQVKYMKEDQYYIYLEMNPILDEDKQDFQLMKMVCFKEIPGLPAYLPRQIILVKPSGQEIETWDFIKTGTNVEGIKPAYFEPEKIAPGWKYSKQMGPRKGERLAPGVPAGLPRPGAPVVPTPGK